MGYLLVKRSKIGMRNCRYRFLSRHRKKQSLFFNLEKSLFFACFSTVFEPFPFDYAKRPIYEQFDQFDVVSLVVSA